MIYYLIELRDMHTEFGRGITIGRSMGVGLEDWESLYLQNIAFALNRGIKA